jgi:uncharacterized membrane protein YgcG
VLIRGTTNGVRLSVTVTVTNSLAAVTESATNEPAGNATPVPTGTCAVTPTAGEVGDRIRLQCSGLEPGQQLRLYWDSTDKEPIKSVRANNAGGLRTTLEIPVATGGDHKILLRGTSNGLRLSVKVKVEPSIDFKPSSARPGGQVEITIKGLKAKEIVDLIWHEDDDTESVLKNNAEASSKGTLVLKVKVPSDAASGKHVVEVAGEGEKGSSVEGELRVSRGGSSSSGGSGGSSSSGGSGGSSSAGAAEVNTPIPAPTREPTDVPTPEPESSPES